MVRNFFNIMPNASLRELTSKSNVPKLQGLTLIDPNTKPCLKSSQGIEHLLEDRTANREALNQRRGIWSIRH